MLIFSKNITDTLKHRTKVAEKLECNIDSLCKALTKQDIYEIKVHSSNGKDEYTTFNDRPLHHVSNEVTMVHYVYNEDNDMIATTHTCSIVNACEYIARDIAEVMLPPHEPFIPVVSASYTIHVKAITRTVLMHCNNNGVKTTYTYQAPRG